jgi:hypothetical protein
VRLYRRSLPEFARQFQNLNQSIIDYADGAARNFGALYAGVERYEAELQRVRRPCVGASRGSTSADLDLRPIVDRRQARRLSPEPGSLGHGHRLWWRPLGRRRRPRRSRHVTATHDLSLSTIISRRTLRPSHERLAIPCYSLPCFVVGCKWRVGTSYSFPGARAHCRRSARRRADEARTTACSAGPALLCPLSTSPSHASLSWENQLLQHASRNGAGPSQALGEPGQPARGGRTRVGGGSGRARGAVSAR